MLVAYHKRRSNQNGSHKIMGSIEQLITNNILRDRFASNSEAA